MNYNDFCERCNHYDFDIHKGILCSLTKDKPNFIDKCAKFELNPDKAESQSTAVPQNTQKSSIGQEIIGIVGGLIGMTVWVKLGGVTGFIVGAMSGGFVSIFLGILFKKN